jgi:hypothetical protein
MEVSRARRRTSGGGGEGTFEATGEGVNPPDPVSFNVSTKTKFIFLNFQNREI